MQKSRIIRKVLLALMLMCYKATQGITARAKTVRDEIENLTREPQNDIFAPVTEGIIQVINVVGMFAIAVVVVILLIRFVKKQKENKT